MIDDDDDDSMAALWRSVKRDRKQRRELFGKECPRCKSARPKAHASILLPGQRCKVDGYVDPRPRIPQELQT